MWDVRSLYRADELMSAARELARCKLDVVGVLEVRWDKRGTVRAGDYDFLYGKGNDNNQLGTGFFVHHKMVSAVKTVESVSDMVPYTVLRGRWCNIIVLNVHAPSEENQWGDPGVGDKKCTCYLFTGTEPLYRPFGP